MAIGSAASCTISLTRCCLPPSSSERPHLDDTGRLLYAEAVARRLLLEETAVANPQLGGNCRLLAPGPFAN